MTYDELTRENLMKKSDPCLISIYASLEIRRLLIICLRNGEYMSEKKEYSKARDRARLLSKNDLIAAIIKSKEEFFNEQLKYSKYGLKRGESQC